VEWINTSAKTLPDAIELALDNLGVHESEAEVVVLEEPKKGIFGRQKGSARVKARVKPKASRPKVERNRNNRNKNRRDGNDGRAKGERSRKKNSSQRKPSKDRQSGGGNRSGAKTQVRPGSTANSGGGRDNKSENNNANGGRGNRGGANSGGGSNDNRQGAKPNRESKANNSRAGQSGQNHSRNAGSRATAQNAGNGSDHQPKTEVPVEEVKQHLDGFLNGLTAAFGFETPVAVDDKSEPDTLIGIVDGKHGLMVGPKGRTLDAIQELARISSQRQVPSTVRIKVDIGGYRQERAIALVNFASKAADKASASGKEVVLDPMSAVERKIVHDALGEDVRVETRSVGTEPRRRLVIVPVDSEDEDQTADDADEEVVEAE